MTMGVVQLETEHSVYSDMKNSHEPLVQCACRLKVTIHECEQWTSFAQYPDDWYGVQLKLSFDMTWVLPHAYPTTNSQPQ